jgi:hypothetical protein
MLQDFCWLIPKPQSNPEVLVAYELIRQFHREVESREEFDRYCQWYRAIAAQHRQELEKMRSDINLFGWFCRKLRRN